MCRLLGYLGTPVQLDRLLYKPDHSLIVQSYQPREMTAGLLNADGFGVGWYHSQKDTEPFTYKNTLPIWNDVNLPSLSRYIESGCVLACVRSATPGLSVDLSNCQPFQQNLILAVHNGFVENFRQTLYRPMRDRLSDSLYHSIQGNTDSEHLFALWLHEWQSNPGISLEQALHHTLRVTSDLVQIFNVALSANLILSNGDRLIACRFAQGTSVPSLYWLRDDPFLPEAVAIASEPLFPGNWIACPENSILTVGEDLDVQIQPI
jgi:glutamine amidotransferase